MAEYISTIIYICIFSIILELILPDNKLKKYVSVLVSLIIIITLLSPIVSIIKTDNVVEAISSAIDSIQSNVTVKEYDFKNLGDRVIFSSVKEDLKDDIYTKCKDKFDLQFGIKKVKISLTEEYTLEAIDIYVKRLSEISMAGEIIDFIANEYAIDTSVINVIKEEE